MLWSGLFHSASFKSHPSCYVRRWFVPFHNWLAFHCIAAPPFVSPFSYCWTCGLLTGFELCIEGSREVVGTEGQEEGTYMLQAEEKPWRNFISSFQNRGQGLNKKGRCHHLQGPSSIKCQAPTSPMRHLSICSFSFLSLCVCVCICLKNYVF